MCATMRASETYPDGKIDDHEEPQRETTDFQERVPGLFRIRYFQDKSSDGDRGVQREV